MDEKFMLNVFSKYASVRNIKIIRDKITGTHQGYGFVDFDSSEIAAHVLDSCNGNLIPNSNKIFKLNWATFSEGKMNAVLGNFSNAVEHTIYVCDLDLNVSEQMLREVFQKLYPSVTAAKLIVDPITKHSKGYGFVKFSDLGESQKAIQEMNGKYILNKAIKTNHAVWKKYNPETKLNSTNSKPYYPKYKTNYKQGYNSQYTAPEERNNYSCQEERNNYSQEERNSYNQEERNINYSSYEEKVEPPKQITQNINIYLQSLYQQHYLNNVYLNQYIGGNSYNFPEGEGGEETLDNMFKNDKISYNDENYNENYTQQFESQL